MGWVYNCISRFVLKVNSMVEKYNKNSHQCFSSKFDVQLTYKLLFSPYNVTKVTLSYHGVAHLKHQIPVAIFKLC